jgi:hypothetical protein
MTIVDGAFGSFRRVWFTISWNASSPWVSEQGEASEVETVWTLDRKL